MDIRIISDIGLFAVESLLSVYIEERRDFHRRSGIGRRDHYVFYITHIGHTGYVRENFLLIQSTFWQNTLQQIPLDTDSTNQRQIIAKIHFMNQIMNIKVESNYGRKKGPKDEVNKCELKHGLLCNQESVTLLPYYSKIR
jgi:hypothetical protein